MRLHAPILVTAPPVRFRSSIRHTPGQRGRHLQLKEVQEMRPLLHRGALHAVRLPQDQHLSSDLGSHRASLTASCMRARHMQWDEGGDNDVEHSLLVTRPQRPWPALRELQGAGRRVASSADEWRAAQRRGLKRLGRGVDGGEGLNWSFRWPSAFFVFALWYSRTCKDEVSRKCCCTCKDLVC